MRVLVVGTVPPPGGSAAARLAAVARERRDAGDEVEFLSPDHRSAAHHHGELAGLRLAFELARLARRFDAVVLELAPGLPLATTADRVTRAAVLGALGAVLRGYGEVTIRLPSPIPLPGGVGGRATRALWSRASSVVVENDEDRDRVLLAPGVRSEAVRIEVPSPALTPAELGSASSISPGDPELRARAQALVRARASRSRELNGARLALGASGALQTVTDPFRGGAGRPTPPGAPAIARLVARKARRELGRLIEGARR